MVDYLHVFSALICFGINILLQIFFSRYAVKISLLKSIFIGFAAGFFCLLLVELLFVEYTPNMFFSIITNLIEYSALGYCYFHFVNLGETARRIRIVAELYDSKEGLSREDILARYNAKDILEKRIKRLVDNKQIIYRDGRYFIGKPTTLLMARVILFFKLVILGKTSEFS